MKNKDINTTLDNGLLLGSHQSITQIYENCHFHLKKITKPENCLQNLVLSMKFLTQLIQIKTEVIVAWSPHMAKDILVNIGSGHGLSQVRTRSLSEPMSTYHR